MSQLVLFALPREVAPPRHVSERHRFEGCRNVDLPYGGFPDNLLFLRLGLFDCAEAVSNPVEDLLEDPLNVSQDLSFGVIASLFHEYLQTGINVEQMAIRREFDHPLGRIWQSSFASCELLLDVFDPGLGWGDSIGGLKLTAWCSSSPSQLFGCIV